MASLTRWLTIACIALVACAGQPDATECVSGIICPEGTKCAAAQSICITTDCGDGLTQSSEACDDGNIVDGDGCSANCQSREVCGDGALNAAAGELCDDRNTTGGDGCAADCRSIEICGNDVRDVNEACDDGNTLPGDGCSGNCKSTEVCGNMIVDLNEKCDDGTTPGGCNDDCQGGTGCGDGAIDKDGLGNPLEECDDGNTDNQDDCTNTCKLNQCGDGIVQMSGTRIEGCDPSVNFGETAGCNIDCSIGSCGDGKLNNAAGEQCDTGTMNADDRDCTSTCEVNICGDSKANLLGPSNLEQCDDGNAVQSDGCSNQCTLPSCGNGVLDMNEQCDDGNNVDTDGCLATCVYARCGDGFVHSGVEQCDAGTANNGATMNCLANCRTNVCGDGFRDQEGAQTEACDDGNMATETSCPYGIQSCMACNMNCSAVLVLDGNVCGDGMVGGPESCDEGDTIQESTCPYGMASCMPCNETCTGRLSLTGPFCGDGTTQSSFGEACDDKSPTQSCGRCGNGCNSSVTAAVAATGVIIASAAGPLQDEERFTINDGFGLVHVFEFDIGNDGLAVATNIEIDLGTTDTAAQVRDKVKNAINGTALLITATDAGSTGINLTHQELSSLGNQPITDTITTSLFYISGMSGGLAGDCPAMTPCTHDDDCQSGNCSSGACQ